MTLRIILLKITGDHDDVITLKHFPRYWPFVREFTGHGEFPSQRPVTRSFDAVFDLRLNKGWINNRKAIDWRRHRAHYDVIVMFFTIADSSSSVLLLLLCYICPCQQGGSLLQEQHMLGSFLICKLKFFLYFDDECSVCFWGVYFIFEDAPIVALSYGVTSFLGILAGYVLGFLIPAYRICSPVFFIAFFSSLWARSWRPLFSVCALFSS